jgi:hypothetical protein
MEAWNASKPLDKCLPARDVRQCRFSHRAPKLATQRPSATSGTPVTSHW